MTYDYIKRTYGVSPEPGKVVYHTVTKAIAAVRAALQPSTLAVSR